jgi:hypothetical protein
MSFQENVVRTGRRQASKLCWEARTAPVPPIAITTTHDTVPERPLRSKSVSERQTSTLAQRIADVRSRQTLLRSSNVLRRFADIVFPSTSSPLTIRPSLISLLSRRSFAHHTTHTRQQIATSGETPVACSYQSPKASPPRDAGDLSAIIATDIDRPSAEQQPFLSRISRRS